MAKSVLDIVIKLSKQGGADKETITGLVKVKSALLDAAAVAGTFVAAGYAIKTVLDQTVGKYVAYAAEVRRASDATGMSTEETSRLIQVLDDVKIEYSALEKVIQKNGDTMNYTTDGLAAMSAEYLSLSSANEKAAFMQERFGKQWVSFVPLMQLGGEAIRKMTSAVEDGLIITEKANRDTRLYEMSIDKVSDSWDSFTNKIGMAFVPGLAELLSSTELNTLQQKYYAEALEKSNGNAKKAYSLSVQMAKAEWMASAGINVTTSSVNSATNSYIAWAKAMQGTTIVTEDLIEQNETLWKQQADQLLSTTLSLVQADDDYASKLADLDAQLRDNKISTEQYQESLEDAKRTHELATNQIIFDIAKMQLAADGWQEGDTAAMFAIGKNLGILTGQEEQLGMTTLENTSLMTGAYERLAGVTEAKKPIMTGALNAITQQLLSGQITAKQYKEKVDALYNNILKLNGAQATAFVNLVVHGSIPGGFSGNVVIPSSGATAGEDAAVVTEGGSIRRAKGGPLGDLTLVGEEGYELIARGKDGQYTVIPHEAAAWMMRAGMIPGSRMAEGGTLGVLGAAAVPSIQNITNNSPMMSSNEMQRELRSLNNQMRGLRSELPSALAAALARSI